MQFFKCYPALWIYLSATADSIDWPTFWSGSSKKKIHELVVETFNIFNSLHWSNSASIHPKHKNTFTQTPLVASVSADSFAFIWLGIEKSYLCIQLNLMQVKGIPLALLTALKIYNLKILTTTPFGYHGHVSIRCYLFQKITHKTQCHITCNYLAKGTIMI